MNKYQIDREILNAFPEEQRKEVTRLWELAKSPARLRQSGQEADESMIKADWNRLLQRIHGQAGEAAGPASGRTTAASDMKKHTTGNFRGKISGAIVHYWYAVISAAAILLAGCVAWYAFVPVTIEAPRGSFVTHEWPDGSRVELNSGSAVSYHRRPWNGYRKLHLSGEAYFDIPPSNRLFVVETHNAEVRVLGTRFNVQSWADFPDSETIITLVEGEVELASSYHPSESILLPPGHLSRVDSRTATPHEPEPVDTQQALAWRDKGFYFSSMSLAHVVAELERRFNTDIEIDDSDLASRTVTMYLPSPEDLETIVISICHLAGCQYSLSDDHYRMY